MANETTDTAVEDQESTDETPTDATEDKTPPEDVEAEGEDGEDDIPAPVLRKKLKDANAEAAKYRTQLRDAQEALSKAKTPEEFATAVGTLTKSNEALERELVAVKYKLPDIIAKRIVGTTREEMEADAKELAKSVRAPSNRDLNGGLNPSEEGHTQADIDAAVNSVRHRNRPL